MYCLFNYSRIHVPKGSWQRNLVYSSTGRNFYESLSRKRTDWFAQNDQWLSVQVYKFIRVRNYHTECPCQKYSHFMLVLLLIFREKQTCNVEMRHLYKRIYFNPGIGGKSRLRRVSGTKTKMSPKPLRRSMSTPPSSPLAETNNDNDFLWKCNFNDLSCYRAASFLHMYYYGGFQSSFTKKPSSTQ